MNSRSRCLRTRGSALLVYNVSDRPYVEVSLLSPCSNQSAVLLEENCNRGYRRHNLQPGKFGLARLQLFLSIQRRLAQFPEGEANEQLLTHLVRCSCDSGNARLNYNSAVNIEGQGRNRRNG